MADRSTAPSRKGPIQQKSAADNVGVYTQPEATDTFQSTAKNRIGVYDRPDRALSSWSPLVIIALILGVLFLLWVLGFFKYLLG